MPISPARIVAFDVLKSVETHHLYAADLLRAKLGDQTDADADAASEFTSATPPPAQRNTPTNPKDAALATELSLGVLRQRSLLDFLIEHLARRPAADLDLEVLLALRLGLYQLRFLDRIPPSAAVNDSVELVKRAKKSSAAALVNAILRRASTTDKTGKNDSANPTLARAPIDPLIPASLSTSHRLAILDSHPAWLIEKWLTRFGKNRAIALLEANNRTPEVAGLFHFPETRAQDQSALEKENIEILNGRWLRHAFRARGGPVTHAAAFRAGRISIRDEASQAVTHLLGVQPGNSILDLCAAPGGKTASLAFAAGPDSTILAADISFPRLRATREQLRRLHLHHISTIQLDATKPLPLHQKFSRILLDVPCTGTGTLARNPEIRWRLTPIGFSRAQAQQSAMLRAALAALAPGGRLVYSTCSLEPEENEAVIDSVLDAAVADQRNLRRLTRDELASSLAPHLLDPTSASELIDSAGAFRTFPPDHFTDGFFAVALEKSF